MKPSIAVIIPFKTLNPWVEECIKECLNLRYDNYKLVLIPDETIKLDNKKIVLISSGKKNPSVKRNIGMKKVKVEYYAFIDSDAYPNKDWLNEGIKSFNINSDIWAVGGPNIAPHNEELKRKAVSNATSSFLLSGVNSFRKKIAKNRYCTQLPTCNLIVKKEAIMSIDGFDSQLDTGEDMALCNRIIKNKGKIFYNNKVIVYHHSRALFKPFILQRFIYGINVFNVLKQEKSMGNLYLLTPIIILTFIIVTILLSLKNTLSLLLLLPLLIIILTESIRQSSNIIEMPLTFMAIIIGLLLPAVGSIVSLLPIKVNIPKIYNNY